MRYYSKLGSQVGIRLSSISFWERKNRAKLDKEYPKVDKTEEEVDNKIMTETVDTVPIIVQTNSFYLEFLLCMLAVIISFFVLLTVIDDNMKGHLKQRHTVNTNK